MPEFPDIDRLYKEGGEFAVYRFPGTEEVRVCGCNESFMVNLWNTPFSENIHLVPGRKMNASLVPWRQSTPYSRYISTTNEIIAGLKRRGGKCVRMRAICGSCNSLDINSAVQALFGRFPDAFCCCFHTPATGMWIGATPELLVDIRGNALHTMALAGTRVAGAGGSWDPKNVKEQQFVTDFICDALRNSGLVPECGATRTLRYGAIEHICTDIMAESASEPDMEAILDNLSPTPAVCGQPRDVALAEIEKAEDAPRRCYAGYMLHRDADGHVRAYVNLRCAQIDTSGWCIYAGGGITADSDAECEWNETEAKASALLEILKKHSL